MSGIIGATGKTQTGKSTKIIKILRDMNAKPLITLDTDGEFSGLLGETAYTLDDVRELWDNKQYQIVVDADQWTPEQMEELNAFVWQLIEALSQKNIDFNYYVSEIWEYAPRWKLPAMKDENEMPLPSYLKRLVKRGRKRGLNFYWDSQQPSEQNPLILSQTTELFAFECWGSDAEYLERRKKGIGDLLETLGEHQYVHMYGHPLTLTVEGPDSVDFDLHKTRKRAEQETDMEMEL